MSGWQNVRMNFTDMRVGDVLLSMCLSEEFHAHVVKASSVTIEVEGEFDLES